MLTVYRTVRGYGQAELEINKSRFIAYVNRVETEEAALSFIEKIRKQHWDATHNCAAYITGDNDHQQKADDDGEPSGTAGRPTLEVIKKSALSNTAVVITRYFGGIKLGAGGLVRAYGKSTTAGLTAAGIVECQLHTRISACFDYALLGAVENNLRNQHYQIIDKLFAEQVTVITLAPSGQESVLETKLIDWTSGRITLDHVGHEYVETNLRLPGLSG